MSSDSEDDLPLSKRKPTVTATIAPSALPADKHANSKAIAEAGPAKQQPVASNIVPGPSATKPQPSKPAHPPSTAPRSDQPLSNGILGKPGTAKPAAKVSGASGKPSGAHPAQPAAPAKAVPPRPKDPPPSGPAPPKAVPPKPISSSAPNVPAAPASGAQQAGQAAAAKPQKPPGAPAPAAAKPQAPQAVAPAPPSTKPRPEASKPAGAVPSGSGGQAHKDGSAAAVSKPQQAPAAPKAVAPAPGSLHAPPHHLASQPAGAKRILPGPTSQQFPSSSCATPARPTRPSAPQPSSIHVGLSPQTAPPNPINILRSHPTAPRSLPSSTVPPSQAPAPTTASSFSAQSSAAVPLSQQPHPSSMPARGLAAGQPAKAPAPARDAPAAKAPSASTSALSGGSNATSGAAAQPQAPAQQQKASANGSAPAPKPAAPPRVPTAVTKGKRQLGPLLLTSSDSDEDDIPLAQRMAPPRASNNRANNKRTAPAPTRPAPQKRRRQTAESSSEESSDEEDDAAEEERPRRGAASKRTPPSRRSAPAKKQRGAEDKSDKWQSLEHSGVLFPPEYEPHGVQMLYEGVPVDLTPEQEEVATHYATMRETAYMEKEKFKDNFWRGFRQVLGKNHVIKKLELCDFTPIWEHLQAQKEAKKNVSREEKLRQKAEKDAAEEKYKFALVDGRREQVGNFRVEPPGLFRGRGEHPKMGTCKRRVYPRDITINIGRDALVPEHPYPGQAWKEVRHDNTVTWLAFWKDTVSERDYKYVWLAANSTFKADSDLAKYEKARKLKDYIGAIRTAYEQSWEASDRREQQMGVALYFIDKLALRAGHEKEEDEADTVGCCTLKVGNVECVKPDRIKFDFLGKDSMRYENETAVDLRVFKLMAKFCEDKNADDMVFDTMDATDLNKHVQELMPGLSIKVFRTYNASITLDGLLHKESDADTTEEKKVDYDRANKEVAILCNHQRSVPKGHAGQMEKLEAKTLALQEELAELQAELAAAKKGKASPGKKTVANVDTVQMKVNRKKEQLAKLELSQQAKEDLKTVALGTSKINYLDPRITVAWCKRREVPMEKIFNKSLLSKFHWAMEVEPDFRF